MFDRLIELLKSGEPRKLVFTEAMTPAFWRPPRAWNARASSPRS